MGDPQGLRHVLADDPLLLTPLITALAVPARHASNKDRRSTGEKLGTRVQQHGLESRPQQRSPHMQTPAQSRSRATEEKLEVREPGFCHEIAAGPEQQRSRGPWHMRTPAVDANCHAHVRRQGALHRTGAQ
jgi:hypothetical protein